MQLPAWAAAHHPIARRELSRWRNHRKSLNWLWLLFLLPPAATVSLFILTYVGITFSYFNSYGNYPARLDEQTVKAWFGVLAGSLVFGLWALQIFFGWGLNVFIVVGASSAVAHERETLNWAMLRLTTLRAAEIVGAKVAALLRWLARPIGVVLALRVLCVGTTLAFFYYGWGSSIFSMRAREVLDFSLIAALFLPIFLFSTLTEVIYTCSLSLLSSTILRVTAQTLALSFGLLLLFWLFVFLPAERIAYLLFSAHPYLRLLPDAYESLLPLIFTFYLAPAVLQIGLASLAFGAAVERARRIVE